tara:strand:+ start:3035 stop:3349 length:315 start_codon:yes stop_codon:yes gene_type:complete
MTHNEMKHFIERVFIPEIEKVRNSGQKEYARDEDNVFANFERVAIQTESSPEKAILTYLLKHIDGIGAFCCGHDSQREDVQGRIHDSVAYLMLLSALIETKKRK